MDCPHCSKAIDGAVSQDTLRQRLASKDQKIQDLESKVEEMKPAADQVSQLSQQVQQLQGQLGPLEAQIGKLSAVAPKDLVDSIPFLELAYNQSTGSMPEQERPDFAAWLRSDDGGRAHPVVREIAARVDGAPAATPNTPAAPAATATSATPEAPAQAASPAATPAPARTPGREPPKPAPKVTARQVQQYLRSPEYRALPREQQEAKLAELQQQVRSGRSSV